MFNKYIYIYMYLPFGFSSIFVENNLYKRIKYILAVPRIACTDFEKSSVTVRDIDYVHT